MGRADCSSERQYVRRANGRRGVYPETPRIAGRPLERKQLLRFWGGAGRHGRDLERRVAIRNYRLSEWGPPGGCGAVYQMTPPVGGGTAWTVTTIYSFAGAPTDGCTSYGSLSADSKGNLYGVTAYGGSGTGCKDQFTWMPGCGTVFELQPPTAPGGSWTETVLYNFTGIDGDGAYPTGGLTLSPNGTLYGATSAGGNVPANNVGYGTVFQLISPTPSGGAWTEHVLHRFNGTDGSVPAVALTLAAGPVLYGTTFQGGTSNEGTVFMLVP